MMIPISVSEAVEKVVLAVTIPVGEEVSLIEAKVEQWLEVTAVVPVSSVLGDRPGAETVVETPVVSAKVKVVRGSVVSVPAVTEPLSAEDSPPLGESRGLQTMKVKVEAKVGASVQGRWSSAQEPVWMTEEPVLSVSPTTQSFA
jgi:hypothetical protein